MENTTATDWETSSTSLFNHTQNFSDCTFGGHKNRFLTALYSLVFMMGFSGNALVVWVIMVGAQLKSMTDVGLLNLALADLVLVLPLPFMIYSLNDSWIFGEAMCTIVLGVYYVGFYGGIFFIVLMSIDRYLAVVHAVFAMRVRTKAHGTMASLVIWILAFGASFPEFLSIRIFKIHNKAFCSPYPMDNGDNYPLKVGIFKNIFGLLVPLSVVGFCYLMILRRLHRSRSLKKHSVRLVVLVMVVFFCCWTPYNIAELLRGLQLLGVVPKDCKFNKWMSLTLWITRTLAFSHSYLNPFLYVFVGEKFRRLLVRLIRERRSRYCS